MLFYGYLCETATAPNKPDNLEDEKSLWITVIGVLGLIITFVLGGVLADSENIYAPYAIYFGMLLFIYYIFLFIGNSRLVETIGGEWGSKIAFSILLAVLFLESNRQASIEINAVFGLSSAAFSGTEYIMTILKTFVLSKVFLGVFAMWGFVAFIYYVITGGSGSHKSFQTFIFAISGLVIGGIGWLLVEFNFNDNLLHKKIYLIAHAFDFNANVNCPGQVIKGPAIFLGPSQNRVYVDESIGYKMGWLQAIYANSDELKPIILPQKDDFKIYTCN